MKSKFYTLIIAFALLFTFSAKAQETPPIVQVPFTDVHITDQFWAPRIETNRTISIPSAFKECEKNGRFDNFAIAAGLMKGKQRGDFPFDDTDPYKIIEGASYSLAVKYDKHLAHYLDSVISIICAAQEPDGYLTTCVTNHCTRLSRWWGTHKWEKLNSHELYNSGHLYEAAIAYYQATGKRTLLNTAIKNADLVCKVFGPNKGQLHRPSGHPIVEMALAKLYKVTGNKKYLDEAKYFIDETGRGTDGHKLSEYSQDYKPILQQTEIKGHAVRAGYLYSGVADVAALTHNKGYYKAIKRIWYNMASKKLYITGGVGSRAMGEGFGPNYELNNQTAYCETCAAIANVFWNERMFLGSGNAKYFDVVERAMFNGVMSGVSLSGNKFFYDNPLESMGQHDRQKWFGCACCPGNITRFVPSIPGYVYATQGNNKLYVNLYCQSNSDFDFAGTKLELNQITGYPWEGNITIEVNPEKSKKFEMKLRIPGWAENKPVPTDLYSFADNQTTPVQLSLNGKAIAVHTEKGYVTIDRKWKKGDKIQLNLPMPVRRVRANENVEDDKGKLAFERGPVMYCIEGVDQNDKHVFNKFIPLNTHIDFKYKKDLLNGVVELTGEAHELKRDSADKTIIKKVPFKAVPYSTWENRGPNEMAVWIPEKADVAHLVPKPTIASQATCVNCYGVNDQWEPKSSSDISKPYFYWWLQKGTKDSIEYAFNEPETVSNVQVYWLNLDQYDGNYRVPQYWKLLYKDGDVWKEVDTNEPYTTKINCYNTLNFKPVKTTGLRIVAQLQKGESGGVIEWKVN